MGCDIHLHVEVFDPKRGQWKPKTGFPCEYCDGTGKRPAYKNGEPTEESEPCFACSGPAKKLFREANFYHSRNYNVFSILADVRNGRGFAGIETGRGFNPIDDPRGLPADVSAEVRKESDEWGVDGHSHSWFTLAELDEYDWNQTVENCGVVSAAVYDKWRKDGRKGRPEAYAGGVSGGNVKNISNEEMDRLIDSGALKEEIESTKGTWGSPTTSGDHHYTKVWWKETYAECASFFLSRLKYLRELGAKPEHVRIVFWFDN